VPPCTLALALSSNVVVEHHRPTARTERVVGLHRELVVWGADDPVVGTSESEPDRGLAGAAEIDERPVGERALGTHGD
jgi:hypothetical protein